MEKMDDTKLGLMNKCNLLMIVQVAVIVACTLILSSSTAYFSPYLLISVFSIVTLYVNKKDTIETSGLIVTFAFSALFSIMVTLANYNLWSISVWGIIKCITVIIGIYFMFANILLFLASKEIVYKTTFRCSNQQVFLLMFSLIAVVNCMVLFLCKYPGFLTYDSIYQITQIMEGSYTNNHPFYHTMILKLSMTIGFELFGNINAAVATYMVFQICFMALSFAFAVMTVMQVGAPRWAVILLASFCIIAPYHIVYSITLWKDVIFGGMVLLFTMFLFRILNSIGNKGINTIGLIFSGVCFCLFRSNGLIAFAGTTFLFILIYRLQYKQMTLIMVAVILVCFILKYPVLKALNVPQPDITESLSIPLQQIALDVIENKDFTDKEKSLINKVVDVQQVPNVYSEYISDPIKELIRKRGNQQVITNNKAEYINLYLARLIKHPSTYLRAWIEQTKGYWNSGYSYWIWCLYTDGVDLGISNKVNSEWMNKLVNKYLSHFLKIPIFKPFISIGLFVWSIMVVLCVAISKKKKSLIMVTIPSLMIILSLLVATPVFSEFRYAYSIFCTAPVIWILAYTSCNKILKANG